MCAGAAPSRLRKLALRLFGVALALLAIELVLQGIALGLWWSRPDSGPVPDGTPAVLCVGDSYTQGMGATSHRRAYPGVLEKLLAPAASVVNGGLIAQSSGQVLQRLPSQLERFRPAVVCVLCGVNDLGYQVIHVPPDEEPLSAAAAAAFPWKCRVWLLAQAIVQWLGGGPAYWHGPEEVPAFVGDWHTDTHEVSIERRGRIVIRARKPGPAILDWILMHWRLVEGRLLLRAELDGTERESAWQRDGENLRLHVPDFPAPFELRPGAAPAVTNGERARKLSAAGNHSEALPLFEKALAESPSAATRADLVECLVGLNQPDRARREAEVLVAAHRTGEPGAGAPAMRALAAVGRSEEALRIGIALHRSGAPGVFNTLLSRTSGDPGKHVQLQLAVEELLRDDSIRGAVRARLLRARFWALRDRDPDGALRALIAADLASNHDEFTTSNIHRGNFSDTSIDRALDALTASAEQRERILRLRGAVRGGAAKALDIVADHLRRIVLRCRAAGAKPILLTYPFRAEHHRAVVRAVAAETGTPLVDLQPHFDQLLRLQRWEDLFIVDGHCSDLGYAEVARAVAARIAPMLER